MKRTAVALVDESRCIGCTLCIDACPVDAIIGAQGRMHAVIDPWCIGCKLCVPPCPVDCIAMVPAQALSAQEKLAVKKRALARKARSSNREIKTIEVDRRAVIARALERKRAR